MGKVDVALPSATQNEVSGDEAKALIQAGAKFVAEGSNMGCSLEAIEIFESERKSKKGDAIWYAPGECFFFGGGGFFLKHHDSFILSPPIPSGTSGHIPIKEPPLMFFVRCREGSKCRRRRRIRAGDGPKLATHGLDVGRSRYQAEGHHGGLLQGRAGNRQGVRRAGRGGVSELGGGQQHCGIQQSGRSDEGAGRLVVKNWFRKVVKCHCNGSREKFNLARCSIYVSTWSFVS